MDCGLRTTGKFDKKVMINITQHDESNHDGDGDAANEDDKSVNQFM